jgi:hypothetical protein
MLARGREFRGVGPLVAGVLWICGAAGSIPSVDTATFLTALWRGLQAFFRAVWGAVTQLFHQITGVFFFVFFALGIAALVREWGTWTAGKLAVTAIFTAVFGWFTAESFWRGRKN